MNLNLLEAPRSPVTKKSAYLPIYFFTEPSLMCHLTRVNDCILENAIKVFYFGRALKKSMRLFCSGVCLSPAVTYVHLFIH